ncbi:hypothetical protein ACIOKD_02460 [Streptomyces sp. NPDC087844]|uniref:hypothetical protein n=1 Tax=Streptomyces sp. NPDC087844 TaxID=3365805 RepID=UPI003823B683
MSGNTADAALEAQFRESDAKIDALLNTAYKASQAATKRLADNEQFQQSADPRTRQMVNQHAYGTSHSATPGQKR